MDDHYFKEISKSLVLLKDCFKYSTLNEDSYIGVFSQGNYPMLYLSNSITGHFEDEIREEVSVIARPNTMSALVVVLVENTIQNNNFLNEDWDRNLASGEIKETNKTIELRENMQNIITDIKMVLPVLYADPNIIDTSKIKLKTVKTEFKTTKETESVLLLLFEKWEIAISELRVRAENLTAKKVG